MPRIPLKLTVRIKYEPSKAKDLLAMGTTEMAGILRSDLDRFKLPHPPVANIGAAWYGVEFFWVTHDGSPLFNAVLRTFDIVNPKDFRRTFVMKDGKDIDDLKEKCFVDDMTMEQSEARPWTLNRRDSFSDRRSPTRRDRSSPPPRRNRVRSESPRRPLGPYNGSRTNNWSDRHSTPKYTPMQFKELDYTDSDDGDSSTSDEPRRAPRPIPESTSTPSIVARLVREYLDVYSAIRTAAGRGGSLEEQLEGLGAKIPEDERTFFGASEFKGESEYKENSKRTEKERFLDIDLAEQALQMEHIMEYERMKLKLAEKILEDVLRECDNPAIIPELLKLVQLGDELEYAA